MLLVSNVCPEGTQPIDMQILIEMKNQQLVISVL